MWVSLRKLAALLAVVLFIIALGFTLNAPNVFAYTITLTPNPVPQGTPVQATSSGLTISDSGTLDVFADNTGSCTGATAVHLSIHVDLSGFLSVTIPTGGLSVGTHCVQTDLIDGGVATALLTVDPPAIPEYPFGLLLLAIFMIVAYGTIRVKTRNR